MKNINIKIKKTERNLQTTAVGEIAIADEEMFQKQLPTIVQQIFLC